MFARNLSLKAISRDFLVQTRFDSVFDQDIMTKLRLVQADYNLIEKATDNLPKPQFITDATGRRMLNPEFVLRQNRMKEAQQLVEKESELLLELQGRRLNRIKKTARIFGAIVGIGILATAVYYAVTLSKNVSRNTSSSTQTVSDKEFSVNSPFYMYPRSTICSVIEETDQLDSSNNKVLSNTFFGNKKMFFKISNRVRNTLVQDGFIHFYENQVVDGIN